MDDTVCFDMPERWAMAPILVLSYPNSTNSVSAQARMHTTFFKRHNEGRPARRPELLASIIRSQH